MQTRFAVIGHEVLSLELPTPETLVVTGVPWGRMDAVMTPAWWKGQAWHHGLAGRYRSLRLGRDLVEETAACLLGGYGMPAEVGLAAFDRLRDAGLLGRRTTVDEIEAALRRPLRTRLGPRRYRFPRQKAGYLGRCLDALLGRPEPVSDRELREWLLGMPGIGPKTASWIVRNHRGSDAVAILDVHVIRACRDMGVFPRGSTPGRDYHDLEGRFLRFADALGVKAGLLDGVMWDQMRILSPLLDRERAEERRRCSGPSRVPSEHDATEGAESFGSLGPEYPERHLPPFDPERAACEA